MDLYLVVTDTILILPNFFGHKCPKNGKINELKIAARDKSKDTSILEIVISLKREKATLTKEPTELNLLLDRCGKLILD